MIAPTSLISIKTTKQRNISKKNYYLTPYILTDLQSQFHHQHIHLYFNTPYHIPISMLITSSAILIFLIACLPHSLPKTALQSQINQIINQVLILPNHILHNNSHQLYLFHPHRSQHIHIPHPKDYPLVTTQSPPVEVFKNYFTWMKKNNNNLTKQ